MLRLSEPISSATAMRRFHPSVKPLGYASIACHVNTARVSVWSYLPEKQNVGFNLGGGEFTSYSLTFLQVFDSRENGQACCARPDLQNATILFG